MHTSSHLTNSSQVCSHWTSTESSQYRELVSVLTDNENTSYTDKEISPCASSLAQWSGCLISGSFCHYVNNEKSFRREIKKFFIVSRILSFGYIKQKSIKNIRLQPLKTFNYILNINIWKFCQFTNFTNFSLFKSIYFNDQGELINIYLNNKGELRYDGWFVDILCIFKLLLFPVICSRYVVHVR